MRSPVAFDIKRTIALATPFIIGQVASVSMGFVDTFMSGKLGAQSLAAVAIGSAIWAAVFLFVMGALMAIPPFVSELDGAKKVDQVGKLVHQALYVVIILSAIFILSMQFSKPIMQWMDIDLILRPLVSGYLGGISWGIPGICGFLLLRFISDGFSNPRPVMYFGFLGLSLNIPFNYILMYGKLGFPEMGVVGIGYASAAVQWFQLFGMLIYALRHKHYREANIFTRLQAPSWTYISRIFKVGLPIGGAIFVEGSLFSAVALMMGSLGAKTAAAHQVAINFASLTFMIPLGLAMAVTVRVGNAVGRKDKVAIRRAGLVGLGLVFFTQVFSAIIMFAFPETIARFYTQDQQVIDIVLQLIFLAAIFQMPDGIQVAAAGALRGLKDTRGPMIITFISFWLIGLSLGYWLGFHTSMGARGMWVGLIAGLSVAAVLLTLRFLKLTRHDP
ncbi:MAG: MATE family efflux transporter [bacterium]